MAVSLGGGHFRGEVNASCKNRGLCPHLRAILYRPLFSGAAADARFGILSEQLPIDIRARRHRPQPAGRAHGLRWRGQALRMAVCVENMGGA